MTADELLEKLPNNLHLARNENAPENDCAKEDLFDSELAALSAAAQLAKKEPCE